MMVDGERGKKDENQAIAGEKNGNHELDWKKLQSMHF